MQIGNCVKEYNWIIINHSELSKKLHHHIEVAIVAEFSQMMPNLLFNVMGWLAIDLLNTNWLLNCYFTQPM